MYGLITPGFPEEQPTAAEAFAPLQKQAMRIRAAVG
jgi:hypothetical protein